MEPLNEQKLLEVLINEHYISEADAHAAQTYSASSRGTIREYLISHNLITSDLIGQAIAELYFLPYADLSAHPVDAVQVQLIPEAIAKRLRAVVFKKDEGSVWIATDVPWDKSNTSADLTTLFPGKKVELMYTQSEYIDSAFAKYRKSLATRFSEILKTQKPVAPELLTVLFDDALTFHASDIHFESLADRVVVRFRVDGVLSEAGVLSKELYDLLVNRIKVLAHLRTDEHVSAQDGAIRLSAKSYVVDLRVSILPTIEGENIVIRILSSYVQSLALTELGISVSDQERLSRAAAKPFGMILITGPTGSGKTTTLYALLKLLNRPDVNIMTIEDPVEYRIAGVNQIQVNDATNLTFAKGLKSILRQDPNIILVGEIRDNETAEIAVNAALTGHLLLSTFHANDAATAIPRLLDMGIEPFLLASTLELVVAQRLVRKICQSCRMSTTLTETERNLLPPSVQASLETIGSSVYKGKGCTACGGTGYKGRTALFEMIEITDAMEAKMLTNPSAHDVWALAREQGSVSMFEDGVAKVKSGVTTIEELIRVVTPPKTA